MLLKKIVYLFFTCLSVLLFSCKTETVDPNDVQLGLQYYPSNTGTFWEYMVERSTYELGDNKIVDTFYVKEVIDPTTFDFDAQLQQISRYRKDNYDDPWVLDSLWTLKKTTKQVIRTEQNEPVVKLVFPIEENTTWNGNAFNNNGYEEFSYEDYKAPYTKSGLPLFAETVHVMIGPNLAPNLIETDQRYEVYARYVGKVYGYYKVLSHQPPDFDTVGVKQVTKILRYGL